MHSHERAVSEVLGYVLVFSLVVSSVAIVSTTGFGQLENVRETEQMNNAERAFDLLAANMEDISQKGAPSRSTEMQLSDSHISVSNTIEITFRGIDDDDSSNNFSESFDVRPIVYSGRASNTEVVYTGGAVFRTYPDSGVVLEEPSIIADDDRVVVPLIHTRSRAVQSRGGGTARIQATHAQTNLLVSDTDSTYETVFMNATSPRADLWVDMIDDYEEFDCTLDESGPTDRAVCEAKDLDRVSISLVQIDVTLTN